MHTIIPTSYQIFSTDYLFSYPECMWMDDNCLIVQDKRAVTKLFHLIDLTDGKLQKSLSSSEMVRENIWMQL